MSLSFQLRNSSLSEPHVLRFPTHLLSDNCFRPVWFDGVRMSIAFTVLSMPSTANIIFSKFDTECLSDSTIVWSITVVSDVLDKVDTRLRISSRPAYAILENCVAPSAAIAGAEGRRQGGKGGSKSYGVNRRSNYHAWTMYVRSFLEPEAEASEPMCIMGLWRLY